MRRVLLAAGVVAGMMGAAGAAAAQDSTKAAGPGVGDLAPDFVLPGATAAGPAGPLRLSDFRGKTVVLAFFFKARTKG